MSKCDWCYHSHLENGKLVCPYLTCLLPERKINEILDKTQTRITNEQIREVLKNFQLIRGKQIER